MTTIAPLGPGIVTGWARKRPVFNVVISNVPGPRQTLYLNGARLDEVYPVSIATHYLALNITISGYGDALGFGYTACRRSVPALQRMLDYTDASIAELEQTVSKPLVSAEPTSRSPARARKASAAPRRPAASAKPVPAPRRRKVLAP